MSACKCGCGREAPISNRNRKELDIKKGEYFSYIVGHWAKTKGDGRYTHPDGYVHVLKPGHPNSTKSGYIAEHIYIVSGVLGRPIPSGACVHHVNSVRDDNRNSNLVLCESTEYHQLLHTRQRALRVCGNPNWRKCQFCKVYDDPAALAHTLKGNYHRSCKALWERKRVLAI